MTRLCSVSEGRLELENREKTLIGTINIIRFVKGNFQTLDQICCRRKKQANNDLGLRYSMQHSAQLCKVDRKQSSEKLNNLLKVVN